MEWWMVALAANGVIGLAYLGIAGKIASSLFTGGQWRSNPLAVATMSIFLSCAVGHGIHLLHLLLPSFVHVGHDGLGMRTTMNVWHATIFDVVTAGVGIWYWTLRGRFPALVRGGAIYEDLRARQQQALDIHDNIVQGLTTAKLSLELGETELGMASLESTLTAARLLVTDLLGDERSGIALGPGDLRRATPAGPR